ncbi:MAG: T9SS type A sorting domain-containing protein [Bacteroidales bacterium]|nr:T9SS type A sorting domain-containing protein [Bacteroidales bacterium]
MRTICILILSVLISTNLFSQINYDTTYSRHWNSSSNSWENLDRIVTTYINGLMASELIQINEDDQWINYNLKAYYYNNGKIIEEFEQYWNDSKLKWVDNYRKLFNYNNDGKLIQIRHQNIYKGKYIDTSKEILIYSSDGKLQEKIIQNYEEAWSNFLRYQYYYNEADLLMDENLAYWKDYEWENPSFRYQSVYDQNDNVVEKIKLQIKGKKQNSLIKEVYLYDGIGNLEEHIVSNWNSKKKKWVNSNRALYTYNDSGNAVNMITQKNVRKNWVNDLSSEFSGIIDIDYNYELADSMTFAVNPSSAKGKATVEFTNPYKEFFQVSIIDETGEMIASVLTDKNEISIETVNLNSGIYFVELQGSSLYSGKFSIE